MTGITFEENYFPNAMIAHADAALGALKCFDRGKVGFINCAIDVVPECDCFPWAGIGHLPGCGNPGQPGHGCPGRRHPGPHRQGPDQFRVR